MRALTFGSVLLVAAGSIVACGEDDDAPAPSSTGGSGSSMVNCPANPSPGDACTVNGTCSNATNCFCLTGSISCTDSPPMGQGGEPGGGGGDVDCGGDPNTGDGCDTAGQCQGSDCFCDGDQVQCFGGGGMADCGGAPMDGGDCSNGPGQCEGSQNCICNFDDTIECI